MIESVYLDHNATTPMRPEVMRAMVEAFGLCGNASSVHRAGRLAREVVERARRQVAALVGAVPHQVTFTSGGTEANDLAVNGAGGEVFLCSAIEHDSVLKARAGAVVVPVLASGVVDLEAFAGLARAHGAAHEGGVASLMLANNETGAIQPVAEAAAIAHANGLWLHCDAVQAAGRIPVDFVGLGVDFLTLSAHKLGGPQGVGALVMADGARLSPRLRGGWQERGRRAGTENVAGVAGFGIAAEAAGRDLAQASETAGLRDHLERRMREVAPKARIIAAGAPRLPNTTCVALPDVAAELQVMALDLDGVMVSAGSACSSGKVVASHVLKAMGCTPEEAAGAIRVSLGGNSRRDDVERFIRAWSALLARLDSQGAGHDRPGNHHRARSAA